MSEQRALLPRGGPAPSRALLAVLDRFEAKSVEVHSLMVVHHGRVVAEGWSAPYSADRPHLLYSLTKSFTSIAVGLAVEDGLLSLDDRVSTCCLSTSRTGSPSRAAGSPCTTCCR